MNDLSDAVERLTRTVEALERRVSALEHGPQLPLPVLPSAPELPVVTPAASGAGIFSLLGKAMLGIAGAYLLRALAESSALPRGPLVAVAIAYGFVWLIPAARAPATARIASLAWAATSVLILVPMLWELTLRFHALSDPVTAGVLTIMVLAASLLAWHRHFRAVTWVANAAASVAALFFAVVTRDMVPFLIALLLIAAVTEIAAARQGKAGERGAAAAAADLGIFALIWVFSSAPAEHGDYRPVSATLLLLFGVILLFIYAASATAQAMILRRGISVFEIAQTLVAFLLAMWGVLVFWSGPGAVVLGWVCLAGSVAGYAVAVGWFAPAHAERNYHVYATGSLALLLAGCLLGLPGAWAAIVLSLCAVVASFVGVRGRVRSAEFHGLACLATALVSSGLLRWVAHTLADGFPGSPGWVQLLVFASTVACWGAALRSDGQRWWHRTAHVLWAAIGAASAAGFIVWLLVRLTTTGAPPASTIALVRTLLVCAASLGLAWSGSLWSKRELIWLAWSWLFLGALKLLVEDLRHGRLAFTAASIFVYAVTLLLVPRVVRWRHTVAGGS